MKNNLRTAINNIKNNGYYVLKNQFSKNICKKLLILTKEIHSSKKNQFKDKTYLMKNTDAVLNLQNKDIAYIKAIINKVLEEILKCPNDQCRSLKPNYPNYIIRSYAARSSIIKMPLHIDSLIPTRGMKLLECLAL